MVISGVLDSSGVTDRYGFSTHFNGSFQITIPDETPATQFQITPAGSPLTELVGCGSMWVGIYPSRRISVHELVRASAALDPSETTAILKAYGPHYRRPGQWIEVLGSETRSPNEEPYYGRLEVLSVGNPLTGLPDPSMLTYRMPSTPNTPGVSDATPPPSGYFKDGVLVGNTAAGFTTDGGSEAVAEGNRVFSTFVGGSYHDTWPTKDQTDRNNYYSDVQTGPFQNMQTDSGTLIQVQAISVVGTTATVTTVNPHGLVPGVGVRIANQLGDPQINKFYRVATVGTNLFTFDTLGDPPSVSPLPYFAAMWQVRQTVKENNVLELSDASHEITGADAIGGMPIAAPPHSVKFFQSAIVRNNIVSVISSTFDNRKPAVQFSDTERALMNGNLIDLTAPSQIFVGTSSALFIDDNRSSTGLAIRPTVLQPSAPLADSLATRIEDALILSL